MKSVSKKQEAIMKQQLRNFKATQAGQASNANWKKLCLQERPLIKLEYIKHHPLNASQNVDILSLLSQLPSLSLFFVLVNENFKHL